MYTALTLSSRKMARTKIVDDYPEDGPLKKGRAVAKRLRAEKEKAQREAQKQQVHKDKTAPKAPRNPADNPPVFSWEADVPMRPSRRTRSGRAGMPPGPHKRAASAEVIVLHQQTASKTKKQKESSKPNKSNISGKAPEAKKESTSDLPKLPPPSSGRRGKGPGTSQSSTSRPTTVVKGNPNQRGNKGTFFKSTFYAEPGATLMRGEVWTEEDDFLLLYLKTDAKMTFATLARYMHPHTQGACQNRFQKMRHHFNKLQGEEKEAAEREKKRVGAKFEHGAWDYRIPFFEEAEVNRVTAAKAKAKIAEAATAEPVAEAKRQAKVQVEEAEQENDEEEEEEQES